MQSPIAFEDSEPEPDLAIVRGPEEKYRSTHPIFENVALRIEVADSSLEAGRKQKGRVYSRACIPIYRIVNLNERQLGDGTANTINTCYPQKWSS